MLPSALAIIIILLIGGGGGTSSDTFQTKGFSSYYSDKALKVVNLSFSRKLNGKLYELKVSFHTEIDITEAELIGALSQFMKKKFTDLFEPISASQDDQENKTFENVEFNIQEFEEKFVDTPESLDHGIVQVLEKVTDATGFASFIPYCYWKTNGLGRLATLQSDMLKISEQANCNLIQWFLEGLLKSAKRTRESVSKAIQV